MNTNNVEKRMLCALLSLSLACSGFTTTSALAQNAGGSITIDFLDPATRKPIPEALLRPGMNVLLRANAHDAAGNTVPCEHPTFFPIQGFTGGQIEISGDIMTGGNNFGSAEVVAECPDLPGVQAKAFVANQTLMTPAEKQQAAAEKAAAGKSVVGPVLVVGGALVGGLALAAAVKAKAEADSGGSSTSSCPTYSQICSYGSSSSVYSGVPPSKVAQGCHCPSPARDGNVCTTGAVCNTQGGFTAGTRLCYC